MARMAAGGARFRIDRLDAHQPHQALDALAIGPDTLAPQLAPDRIRIIEWDLLGPRHRRALASQLTTISQEHKLHTICVIASAPTTREARAALAQGLLMQAKRAGVSSLHVLFPDEPARVHIHDRHGFRMINHDMTP